MWATSTVTPIKSCYFAGEIDLTKYGVTTPPYKRLGGLVGKVESGTPVFKNNYYTKTANVDSCATNGTIAGTAESIDSMKTKEFYDKLTQNGGDYRFNPNGTPLLPEHKYPTAEETPRYYYSSATTAKDEGKTGSQDHRCGRGNVRRECGAVSDRDGICE